MQGSVLGIVGVVVLLVAMAVLVVVMLRYFTIRDVKSIERLHPDALVFAATASTEMLLTVRREGVALEATWPDGIGARFIISIDSTAILFWEGPDWRLARLRTSQVRSIEFDVIDTGSSMLNGLRIHSVIEGRTVDLAMFVTSGATLGVFPATAARIESLADAARRVIGLSTSSHPAAERS